jgi:hypothetical protein
VEEEPFLRWWEGRARAVGVAHSVWEEQAGAFVAWLREADEESGSDVE